MDLNVTITLSDRLFELLEDKLPSIRRRVEKVLTKQVGAQVREESSISVSVSATPTPPAPEAEAGAETMAEPVAGASGEAAESETAQPASEPETPAEAPAQQPEKKLTEEDIRAALHRTRQRLEGEDYKENTGSEVYKKYHKQLTAVFLRIAKALGADKPSTLSSDTRAAFIAECDALIIDENGAIISTGSILNK